MSELKLGNIKPVGADNVVVESKYVKGGYVVVTSTTERDALKGANGENIINGSLCYCTADSKFYQYNGTTWAEKEFGTTTEATTSAAGLMSAADKENLDIIVDSFNSDDANTTIDTIKEVLQAFESAPEGTNIANVLAGKADANHNHDNAYAPIDHDHNHNHDDRYSQLGHNHDDRYTTNLKNGEGSNSLTFTQTDSEISYKNGNIVFTPPQSSTSDTFSTSTKGKGALNLTFIGKTDRNHFLNLGNQNIVEYSAKENNDLISANNKNNTTFTLQENEPDDGGVIAGYKHYSNSRGTSLFGAWNRALTSTTASKQSFIGGYRNTLFDSQYHIMHGNNNYAEKSTDGATFGFGLNNPYSYATVIGKYNSPKDWAKYRTDNAINGSPLFVVGKGATSPVYNVEIISTADYTLSDLENEAIAGEVAVHTSVSSLDLAAKVKHNIEHKDDTAAGEDLYYSEVTLTKNAKTGVITVSTQFDKLITDANASYTHIYKKTISSRSNAFVLTDQARAFLNREGRPKDTLLDKEVLIGADLTEYDRQRRANANLLTELKDLERDLENKIICTFNITESNSNVSFSVSNKEYVNWGDGTISIAGKDDTGSHIYKNPGEYTCIISGTSAGLSFPQFAFRNCSALKHVIVKGVNVIAFGAFTGCVNLESVIIGKNVSVLEDRAFENCSNLKTVTIQGATSIRSAVFSGCISLDTIIIESAGVGLSSIGALPDNLNKIIVPTGELSNYRKTASNWSLAADKIIGAVDPGYLTETLTDYQRKITVNPTGTTSHSVSKLKIDGTIYNIYDSGAIRSLNFATEDDIKSIFWGN